MTQPPYPQQPYGQPNQYGPPPDNNLVWAVLVTLFCCQPLGIVALVRATEVQRFWSDGLQDHANWSADQAKKWAMWGAIIGGVVIVVVILIYVIAIAAAVNTVNNY